MIRDAFLSFGTIDFSSTNMTVTSGIGSINFPNAIDLRQLRDIGKGGPLLVQLDVLTAVTMTLAAGVDYAVLEPRLVLSPAATTTALEDLHPINGFGFWRVSNSENFASPANATAYHSGNLTAGKVLYSYLPPLDGLPLFQYLQMVIYPAPGLCMANTSVGEAVISGGSVKASLVVPGTDTLVNYASGFSV